jgi:hypothetical protein
MAATEIMEETALGCGDSSHPEAWCLDSGATSHMTAHREKIQDLQEISQVLSLASKEKTRIEGQGAAEVVLDDGSTGLRATMNNTLFVPDLRTNLMSVSKLTDNGLTVTFKKDAAYVMSSNDDVLAIAKRKGNLYIVREIEEQSNRASVETKKSQTMLWHEKLGHLNPASMKLMLNNKLVKGLKFKGDLDQCQVCIKGKQTQTPFPKRPLGRTEQLLEIIHSDLCGPVRIESKGGGRYFAVFIDDYSRWCEIYILKNKSEIFEAFKTYKATVENFTGFKIKSLQSDNALEYMSNDFEKFLQTNGIKRRLTVPHTPQQNGVAERKNRTLVEMARCLLMQSNLPPSFWAEAINTANYIRNRVPSSSLKGETPFKIWTGKRPYIGYFKPFGVTALALNKDPKKGKFDSRSIDCIFIGYLEESKAFKLWAVKEKKFFRSRDVKFLSSFLPPPTSSFEDFHQMGLPEQGKAPSVMPFRFVPGDNVGTRKGLPRDVRRVADAVDTQEEPDDVPATTEAVDDQLEPSANNEDPPGEKPPDEDPPNLEPYDDHLGPPDDHVGPGEDDDDEDDQTTVDEPQRTATPKQTRGPGRPTLLRTGKPGRPAKVYKTTITGVEEANLIDPVDVKSAVHGPDADDWKRAIIDEYVALMSNSTWDIVDFPIKNHKLIQSRFVLKTKLKSNGDIERRKARLVAKGYNQRPGIDFDETFAPVVRMGTVRTMMALSTELKLIVHQMDVVSAYLNGDLEEELYMSLPDELEPSLWEIIRNHDDIEIVNKSKIWLKQLQAGGRKVCRIRKSIYGLRQSGRQWNKKLDQTLKSLGLKPMAADPCLYVQKTAENLMLVAIYVDDLIIATNDMKKMSEIKESLQSAFKMKDLGPIHYCLGIEFKQDLENNTITMSQAKYSEEILQRFEMDKCSPLSTPLDPNEKLERSTSKEENDFPYQSLIGAIMYLAVSTRPDLAYPVSALSQFNTQHGEEHWNAAIRVLRYLRGTSDYALVYRRTGAKLQGYIDADWGNCVNDRRSYSGYAFILGNAAICWDAKKQRTVSLSSTESEYMAMCEGTKEAMYLRNFLGELGFERTPVTIFNDNQGAQHLVKNPVHHKRTKHIDIRYHFIKEAFENKIIETKYLPTSNMIADILTKPVFKMKLNMCVKSLGITRISALNN